MMRQGTARSFTGKRQLGQSTVEFLILALALIPLFVTLPLLGKYLDLTHATEHAARYVAFETSVFGPAVAPKSEAVLAAEIRRRFFGPSDASINSGDGAGNTPAHRNPLWTTPRGEPLLDDFSAQVGVNLRSRSNPAPVTALLAGEHGLKLPGDSEHTASISVSPRNIQGLAPFDTLDLQITRHQVVLSDGWAEASSRAAERRIEDAGLAAYPIAPLKLIGTTVGTVLPRLMLDEAVEVGRVRSEIVPCDRLEGGC
ncbi:MAG TPA: hypothetical protein PKW99_06560 [Thauera sp.]|nr:hypothetical protein [Thauera sp.]